MNISGARRHVTNIEPAMLSLQDGGNFVCWSFYKLLIICTVTLDFTIYSGNILGHDSISPLWGVVVNAAKQIFSDCVFGFASCAVGFSQLHLVQ